MVPWFYSPIREGYVDINTGRIQFLAGIGYKGQCSKLIAIDFFSQCLSQGFRCEVSGFRKRDVGAET